MDFAGETRFNTEREFNGYFRKAFDVKHSLPALFIDAYPDPEDEAEIRANINEVVQLRKITEALPPFPLEDAEVIFLVGFFYHKTLDGSRSVQARNRLYSCTIFLGKDCCKKSFWSTLVFFRDIDAIFSLIWAKAYELTLYINTTLFHFW